MIREGSNVSALYHTLGGGPMILEGFVSFEREVSVIATRSVEGDVAVFDLCENEHERHILARTRVPARVAPQIEADAKTIAAQVLAALDYVGTIGVEMFVARAADGAERLIINEIAPRVHNSGHWTIDGAATSQFEQHVRAISGWPLGSVTRRGDVEMHNLIGEDAEEWRDILAQPELSLHLYGKLETRPRPQDGPCDQGHPREPQSALKYPRLALGQCLQRPRPPACRRRRAGLPLCSCGVGSKARKLKRSQRRRKPIHVQKDSRPRRRA